MTSTGLMALDVTAEIELEFTNRCNASCTACPRDDMPAFGMMTESTLERILDLYESADASDSDSTWIVRRVTIAGGGDPLIHPNAPEFIERIARRGFATHLITNAFAANAARIDALIAGGVGSVAVSFWGVEPEEYERSMQLPFARTLANVEQFAAKAAEHEIPFVVTWVRADTIHSTDDEIAAFWADRGIAVDCSDNQMWNRGGLPAHGPTEPTDTLRFPDASRSIWCADLALSDSWTWDGSCVMCCCTYFTSDRQVLGHIDRDTHAVLKERKREILAARPLPAMCQSCLQPRRAQASWLAEPIRHQIDAPSWADLSYADVEA